MRLVNTSGSSPSLERAFDSSHPSCPLCPWAHLFVMCGRVTQTSLPNQLGGLASSRWPSCCMRRRTTTVRPVKSNGWSGEERWANPWS